MLLVLMLSMQLLCYSCINIHAHVICHCSMQSMPSLLMLAT
jgi:hypothetical protein